MDHPSAELDAFVVMPNHVHGIIVTTGRGAIHRAHSLGEIVRAFKARANPERWAFDRENPAASFPESENAWMV